MRCCTNKCFIVIVRSIYKNSLAIKEETQSELGYFLCALWPINGRVCMSINWWTISPFHTVKLLFIDCIMCKQLSKFTSQWINFWSVLKLYFNNEYTSRCANAKVATALTKADQMSYCVMKANALRMRRRWFIIEFGMIYINFIQLPT